MGSKHNDDPRRWPDGVETYPADLSSYGDARRQLAQFQVPQLGGAEDSRVFVANFDGSWNDKDKDEAPTNVANIYTQVLEADSSRIKGGYQPGVGTQESWLAQKADGALGYSYGPRMEKMYYDFCVQAKKWTDENPNAEISLAATGFSRGAVTAAMFTRLVHERGIQNPVGMGIERDSDGDIIRLTPTQPNLVPPGKTRQVVGLFDPVATGAMNGEDTRLPPSVVSGFQITARDEKRDAFQSKQIIDPGLSDDGRFLSVQVAGAHSNIGGGYLLNGLSVRNGNLMGDYLNAVMGSPVLRDRAVSTVPEMNVIHRSEQGNAGSNVLYSLHGERQVVELLTKSSIRAKGEVYSEGVVDGYDAEPADRALLGGLYFARVAVGVERQDHTVPPFLRPANPAPPLPGIGAPLPSSRETPAEEEVLPFRKPLLPTLGVPSEASHPDYPMLLQIREGVGKIDAGLGKPYDDTSERMSRSLLAESKGAGLERVDHVVMGRGGAHVFAVQGDLHDPAHRRAHVATDQAVRTPVEQSDQQLLAMNQSLARDQAQAQAALLARGPDDPSQSGPTRQI